MIAFGGSEDWWLVKKRIRFLFPFLSFTYRSSWWWYRVGCDLEIVLRGKIIRSLCEWTSRDSDDKWREILIRLFDEWCERVTYASDRLNFIWWMSIDHSVNNERPVCLIYQWIVKEFNFLIFLKELAGGLLSSGRHWITWHENWEGGLGERRWAAVHSKWSGSIDELPPVAAESVASFDARPGIGW